MPEAFPQETFESVAVKMVAWNNLASLLPLQAAFGLAGENSGCLINARLTCQGLGVYCEDVVV